jgi:hypothetical protein
MVDAFMNSVDSLLSQMLRILLDFFNEHVFGRKGPSQQYQGPYQTFLNTRLAAPDFSHTSAAMFGVDSCPVSLAKRGLTVLTPVRGESLLSSLDKKGYLIKVCLDSAQFGIMIASFILVYMSCAVEKSMLILVFTFLAGGTVSPVKSSPSITFTPSHRRRKSSRATCLGCTWLLLVSDSTTLLATTRTKVPTSMCWRVSSGSQ